MDNNELNPDAKKRRRPTPQQSESSSHISTTCMASRAEEALQFAKALNNELCADARNFLDQFEYNVYTQSSFDYINELVDDSVNAMYENASMYGNGSALNASKDAVQIAEEDSTIDYIRTQRALVALSIAGRDLESGRIFVTPALLHEATTLAQDLKIKAQKARSDFLRNAVETATAGPLDDWIFTSGEIKMALGSAYIVAMMQALATAKAMAEVVTLEKALIAIEHVKPHL